MDFTIKTREELLKLSLEELKIYNKALKEHKEKLALLEDSDEPVVTVTKKEPIASIKEIADEKAKGNKNPEHVQEVARLVAENEQLKKAGKSSFGSLTIEDSVKKSFGAEGDDIVAMTKDIAAELPVYDAIAKMTGKKVIELDCFRKQHGSISKEQLKKVLECIEKQNMESVRSARNYVSKTALDTSADSTWVPVGFETSVVQQILKAKAVAGNIPSFDAPTASFDWPTQGGNPTVYSDTESLTGGEITLSGSKPTSSKTTWTAAKIACRVDFSDEMNEDVAFALLPQLNFQMGDAIGDGFERVCLFGDTATSASTNINIIDGTPTTTAGGADVFLATNGLIKKALASNGSTKDCSGAASPSEAIRLTMASAGEGMKDVVMNRLFVPPAFYYAMLDDPSVKNVFNYGPNAAILTGEVGRVFGIPVLMTSGIPLTNTAGKISTTSSNNVLASFVLVNSSKVMVAYRRRLKIASNFFVITDNYRLVASMRFDIQQFGANQAGKNPIGYGYNYAV